MLSFITIRREKLNRRYLRIEGFLILIVGFLAGACRHEVPLPPVLVSQPVGLLSSAEGNFQYAGLSFQCCNTGNRRISSLCVSFIVYTDETGGNPFFGSNVINAEVVADLLPGTSAQCEISLDDKLTCIPETPFVIECFYVTKVTFADDSEWSDPYGFFYAGSLLP